MSGMSGAQARPAASLSGGVFDGANARRFGVAMSAAVVLHAVLLLARPGALASSYVAPSAPAVMAVRLLQAPPVKTAMPPTAEAPAAAAPRDEAPVAAPQPQAADVAKRSLPAVPEPRAAAPTGAEASQRIEGKASTADSAATDSKGADTPLAAAPDYALGVRLDPGPKPLDDIEPDYPDTVHLREGVVVLRLLISDTGHVDNVAVVRSEPRGVFEQAALDAFSKARFSPGLAAGTPVKSQITVEVQFVPINRGGRVSGRTY